MDEDLRALERQALEGDEEALAELDRRARRLGGAGVAFRQPLDPGEVANDYDDWILSHTRHAETTRWDQTPLTKRFVRTRHHRANRRRVRQSLQRGGRGRPPDA